MLLKLFTKGPIAGQNEESAKEKPRTSGLIHRRYSERDQVKRKDEVYSQCPSAAYPQKSADNKESDRLQQLRNTELLVDFVADSNGDCEPEKTVTEKPSAWRKVPSQRLIGVEFHWKHGYAKGLSRINVTGLKSEMQQLEQ